VCTEFPFREHLSAIGRLGYIKSKEPTSGGVGVDGTSTCTIPPPLLSGGWLDERAAVGEGASPSIVQMSQRILILPYDRHGSLSDHCVHRFGPLERDPR
jgi:hypothetical protein